jgi:hypothetical protein
MTAIKEFEVIVCKCGGAFAACTQHDDENWIQEKAAYIAKGCTIEMREEIGWAKCTCPKLSELETEMLEALKEAEKHHQGAHSEIGHLLREIIAKAEGGNP